MSVTWQSPTPPPDTGRAPGHWRRVLWRGGRIALVIGAGVLATLVLRLAGEVLLAQWAVFVVLTVAHLFCNARAVRALALATLNQNRLSMLL